MSLGEIIQTISQQCAANKAVNRTLAEAIAQLIQEKQELEAKEVQV